MSPRDLLLLVFGLLPPSRLKTRLLNALPGVDVHPTATVGPCVLFRVRELAVEEGATIGALNVIRDLDGLRLSVNAIVGKMNYFSAMRPAPANARVWLELGPESALTNRHYLDCSGGIRIGGWTTVAGSGSTFLTHGIDPVNNEQTRSGISIGEYSLISGDVRITPGTVIGNRVMVAMGAVVSGQLTSELQLYGGVPARPIKPLDPTGAYWHRERGPVSEPVAHQAPQMKD